MAENDFISNAPRALVETIAFIYLAFLSLYVVLTSVNGLIVLSKIAVIAIACQKVLPQLQQIYASWTRLSGNSKAIEKILYSKRLRKIQSFFLILLACHYGHLHSPPMPLLTI